MHLKPFKSRFFYYYDRIVLYIPYVYTSIYYLQNTIFVFLQQQWFSMRGKKGALFSKHYFNC